MRFRTLIAVAALAVLLAVPAVAGAAAKPAVPATQTYNLDFTLPTEGKSGCTVCHSDPNLVKTTVDSTTSIYVNTEILNESAHKDVACTGCHIDFAYKTPHDNVVNGEDWRAVAKLACKNCHAEAFSAYASSAHSPAGKPGEDASATAAARVAAGKPARVPLCGDCHGGHGIPSKEDTAAQAVYHSSALDVCGQCHEEFATTYMDYYHGAAYQRGAYDSPACWDCHGTHEILPAKNRNSMVNPVRLPETCSMEDKCHINTDEAFVEYGQLVHSKEDVYASIPFWSAIDAARNAIGGAVQQIGSWITGQG